MDFFCSRRLFSSLIFSYIWESFLAGYFGSGKWNFMGNYVVTCFRVIDHCWWNCTLLSLLSQHARLGLWLLVPIDILELFSISRLAKRKRFEVVRLILGKNLSFLGTWDGSLTDKGSFLSRDEGFTKEWLSPLSFPVIPLKKIDFPFFQLIFFLQ